MERDQETNTKLEKSGWVVLRFWETEVKKDLKDVQVVEQAIGDRSI